MIRNIKSYTDLEQSEKLAEILPLESADMMYVYDRHLDKLYGDTPYVITYKVVNEDVDFPCWSLTALLGLLSFPALRYDIENGEGGWIVGCEKNDKMYLSHYRDNPVDTCYEMIIHLHELKNK